MLTQRHDDATLAKAGAGKTDELIRFRAATLDEAIELAEQSLGARAKVVAANQLRRGGIGGFFAADLGVVDDSGEGLLDRLLLDDDTDLDTEIRGEEPADATAA